MAALVAALDVPGCDGVEFDVRASRDGVPVVIHDATLARVQGRPDAVGSLSADELASVGIARLSEVLEALPGRAFLDVELKEDVVRAAVAALRRARGPDLDRAVISSFDTAVIAAVRAEEPAWPTWLNADDLSPHTLEVAGKLGSTAVSVRWQAVDPDSVGRATGAGLAVAAWTVRRRSVAQRLVELGVVALCVEGRALDR